MPAIPDSFRRAFDANGDPVPGALLTVYEAGTTTEVTTYSDDGLTVPQSSPVVADASGGFAQIYVPNGDYKIRTTTAAGVDIPGSPADDIEIGGGALGSGVASLTEAAATAIYPVRRVRVRGFASDGDGGAADYEYVTSEPAVATGKFQDDGGYWFRLADRETHSRQHGAKWDGSTDDTAAINACAVFARTYGRAVREPGGTAYCAGTMYLGGIAFRGPMGPTNSSHTGSKAIIMSDGNPMLSLAPTATTAQTLFGTVWEDFTVVGAGGTVPSIELWDRASYDYQVGIWLGRNHLFMQTASGGESGTSGGGGGIHMHRVSVQDASGWGIYLYKLWGQSIIDGGFIRRCGGPAAYGLSDDRLGGAICIASGSVDFTISGLHDYTTGYSNGDHDERGCGIRIGAVKSEVEAGTALDRFWTSGSGQVFSDIHIERRAIALAVDATKGANFEDMNLVGPSGGGGLAYIGRASNPEADITVEMRGTRVADLATLEVSHGNVDLGTIRTNQAASFEIKYGDDVRFDVLPAQLLTMTPVADPSTLTGGSGTRSTYSFWSVADTNVNRADRSQNQIPAFSASGTPTTLDATEWTDDGGSVVVQSRSRVQVKNDGTDDGVLYHEVTGLTEGDLCTLEVWFKFTANNALQDHTLTVTDGSTTTVFERVLGNGTATSGTRMYQAAQFKVPASGTVRIQWANAGTQNAELHHPIFVVGALPKSKGGAPLFKWPARDGDVTVA